jgi:hypothetical protein
VASQVSGDNMGNSAAAGAVGGIISNIMRS